VSDLNREISDAVGLISLLLVFVVAFFAAIWPQASSLLSEPIPAVATDRAKLVGRLKAYRWLLVVLVLLVVVILVLLAPLTLRILARVEWGGSYDTLRAGLLLVVLLLVMCLAVAIYIWNEFRERINKVNG